MKSKESGLRKSRVAIPFLKSGTAKVNTKKCLKKETAFSFLKFSSLPTLLFRSGLNRDDNKNDSQKNYRIKFAALAVFVFGFLSFFALYPVFASPPDSPYAPGSTLNPTCSPGDTNCTVASPIVSIFSATSTVTMNDYALAFHGSASNTLYIDALNSRIGIGTSGPSDMLTVIGNGAFGDGSTTSTLTKNSLTIAGSSSDTLGKLYIDSSGNISASGTLNSYGAATLRNGLTLSGAGLTMTGLDIGAASTRAGTGYFTTVSSTNAHFSILNVSSTLYLPNNSILDAYLSSNIPLINANNTFTGNNTFSGSIVSPLSISDGSTTSTLTTNTFISGKTSSAAVGKFYIDSDGNVNASGTLAISGASATLPTTTLSGTSRLYLPDGTVKLPALGFTNDPDTGFFRSDSGITTYASNGATSLAFRGGSAIAAYSIGSSYFSSSADFDIDGGTGSTGIHFNMGTSEKMRLNASGYLGIGTTGPSDILTVIGNGAFGDGSTTSTITKNSLTIAKDSTHGAGLFYVGSSGNVNASGTLRIYGGATTGGLQISATDATTTLTSYITDGAGASAFAFNSSATMTSGTDRMLAVFQNNGVNKVEISAGGNVYAKNSFIANSSEYGIGDVAEYINLKEGEAVEFGDVLVVDEMGLNQYKKSTIAHAKNVAGVVSDTGKFVIGASGPGRAPLALAGLVKVKVSDENGHIAVGDYLVTASKSGYAMKYNSAQGQAAGLVGMALEPLVSNEGTIMIMVNKGFVDGAAQTTQNITNLSVIQNAEGNLQMTQAADLDMSGFRIIKVKGIASLSNLWSIGDDGKMAAKELKVDKIQSKQILVEKDADAKKSAVGEGTIVAGTVSVEIENEMASTTAKIFITFRGNTGGVWWISKVEQGKFEVSLSQPASQDVSFDYWIISVIPSEATADEGTLSGGQTPVIPLVVPEPLPIQEPVQEPTPAQEPQQPVVEPEPVPVQEPVQEPSPTLEPVQEPALEQEQQQPTPEVQPEPQQGLAAQE